MGINLIDRNDLEYIDNIYSSKNFGLADDSHIKDLKASQETLLMVSFSFLKLNRGISLSSTFQIPYKLPY